MKKLMISIVALLIAIVFSLFPCGNVLADQADPDSVPTVDIYCYRNLLETGDVLIYLYANIPYASLPDEPVNAAFVWRLIDTDNTTELGSTTGYPYNDLGYGYNVYSMYFSAADALTWGAAYTIQLSGNPVVFDDPPLYNFPITSSDWTTYTTQADNRDELELRILITAGLLYSQWGLTADTALVNEQEIGTVLSLSGEAFFRGAIYGLQALAPGVFYVVPEEITAEDRTWTENYTSNLSSQYTGTWIAISQQAGADLFESSYDLTSVILCVVLLVVLFFGSLVVTGDHWQSLINVCLIAVVLGRLGLYEATFLGMIAALCWLYISSKVWGLTA